MVKKGWRDIGQLDPVVKTIAGGGSIESGEVVDDVPATDLRLGHTMRATAVAADGSVYLNAAHSLRRIDPDGIIRTIAGDYRQSGDSGDGGPASEARFKDIADIALAPDGTIYIADSGNHKIRQIDSDGIVTTVAGTGTFGFSGDGGPAHQAMLFAPQGVTIAPDGSLYIADTSNHRIRRVSPSGIIETVAGTGESGFSGDDGRGIQAMLSMPHEVAVGPDGSLYIADTGNNRIRKVDTSGIITTIAGTGDTDASSPGDGGPATMATVWSPRHIALSHDGTMYATGQVYVDGNSRELVRRIGADSIITTVAGRGNQPFEESEGGPATALNIFDVQDVTVASDGHVYFIAEGSVYPVGPSRLYRLENPFPGFDLDEIVMPSSDGMALYVFDAYGRHLRTLHALTGAILYRFSYDDQGRLTSITDGDGDETVIERDAQGNPTAIVAPTGQRTTLTLDSNGYLASISNPASETRQFSYSDGGLLVGATDAAGNSSRYAYDELGLLVRTEDAAGGSQQLSRTESDDLQSSEVTLRTALDRVRRYMVEQQPDGTLQMRNQAPDSTQAHIDLSPDGAQTMTLANQTTIQETASPDPRWGMLAPIDSMRMATPTGLETELTSSRTVTLTNDKDLLSLDELLTQVTINGRQHSSLYDAQQRQFTYTSAAGRTSSTTIDEQGRIIREEQPGLAPVTYTYNAHGWLVETIIGTGDDARTLHMDYDTAGHLIALTDALGQTTRFSYDAAGRVTETTLADGRDVLYTYDSNGSLTSITPPGRPAHRYTYNPVGLLASYMHPGSDATGVTSYTYNLDRQLDTLTMPGATITYGYNNGGRLATLTAPHGTNSYSYNAHRQVDTITAPGNIGLAYTYDGILLTGETWTGPVEGSVTFAYDHDFRINATSVNGAHSISYQYDNDSLLTRSGDMHYTRDSQTGFVTASSLGSVSDSLTYNSFGEVTDYQASYGGSPIYQETYDYDPLGRIVIKQETIAGTTTSYSYTYDIPGRLIEVRRDGVLVEQYTYDPNGNRLSATLEGTTATGSYDDQDRLLSYGDASYTHTANGEWRTRTVAGQTTTYTYDALGNLREVALADGRTIGYRIDGLNRRVGRTVDGSLERVWLYADQLNPIAELDASGNVISRFVYGIASNAPDYMLRDGQTYRIITDQLGSPRLVVNMASGDVVQRLDYDSYGNVTRDTNPGFQPFGFAAGLYDPDTGLVRFGARDYDAQSGRWTAKDPIGFAGGDLNLYAYAMNDPVNFVDPDGLGWDPVSQLLRKGRNITNSRHENTRNAHTISGHKGLQRDKQDFKDYAQGDIPEFAEQACQIIPGSPCNVPYGQPRDAIKRYAKKVTKKTFLQKVYDFWKELLCDDD